MEKNSHTVLSGHSCLRCNKKIKQNLVDKKEVTPSLCYKCFRISNGKPAHHTPRAKRVAAGLPVHTSRS